MNNDAKRFCSRDPAVANSKQRIMLLLRYDGRYIVPVEPPYAEAVVLVTYIRLQGPLLLTT